MFKKSISKTIFLIKVNNLNMYQYNILIIRISYFKDENLSNAYVLKLHTIENNFVIFNYSSCASSFFRIFNFKIRSVFLLWPARCVT